MVDGVSADHRQQQILTCGLQAHAGEGGHQPFGGVARTAQEWRVARQLRLAAVEMRRIEKRAQRFRDIAFVKLAFRQVAAENRMEPLEGLAAGIQNEKGEPAAGNRVAADVEIRRADRAIQAYAGDFAGSADVVDVAVPGDPGRERAQHGVIAAAENHRVAGQPQFSRRIGKNLPGGLVGLHKVRQLARRYSRDFEHVAVPFEVVARRVVEARDGNRRRIDGPGAGQALDHIRVGVAELRRGRPHLGLLLANPEDGTQRGAAGDRQVARLAKELVLANHLPDGAGLLVRAAVEE